MSLGQKKKQTQKSHAWEDQNEEEEAGGQRAEQGVSQICEQCNGSVPSRLGRG